VIVLVALQSPLGHSKKPFFLIICGPSGCGKRTVTMELLKAVPADIFYLPVSWTGRPQKSGEAHGEDYFFTTDDEMQRKLDAGELITWDWYEGHLYGDVYPPKGVDLVLLEVTIDAALQVRDKFPDSTLIIWLEPNGETEQEKLEFLDGRLQGRRRDTDEEIAGRLQRARQEMQCGAQLQGLHINNANSVDTAVTILDVLHLLDVYR
jgi:guanylate kinase